MNIIRQSLRLILLAGLIASPFVASATVLDGTFSTTLPPVPNYWFNNQYVAKFSYDTGNHQFALLSLDMGGFPLLSLPGTITSTSSSTTHAAWKIDDAFYDPFLVKHPGYYILQAQPSISFSSSKSSFSYSDGFDTWYAPSDIGPWNIYFNFVSGPVPIVQSGQTGSRVSAPEPSSFYVMLAGLGILILMRSASVKYKNYLKHDRQPRKHADSKE